MRLARGSPRGGEGTGGRVGDCTHGCSVRLGTLWRAAPRGMGAPLCTPVSFVTCTVTNREPQGKCLPKVITPKAGTAETPTCNRAGRSAQVTTWNPHLCLSRPEGGPAAGQGKAPRLGDRGLPCAGLRTSNTVWLPRAQRHHSSCPSHARGPAWNTSDRMHSAVPIRCYWRGLKSKFHESFFVFCVTQTGRGLPGPRQRFRPHHLPRWLLRGPHPRSIHPLVSQK